MRCPYCGSLDDKVIESRTMASGEAIRRRRECVSCGYRFTSYEKIDEKPFMVVKSDGKRREPFDRTKLERGIVRALEKRPVSPSMIENIVNDIEDQAIMKGKTNREILTSELGELVLKRLQQVDKVAYIRFASVYKHFENLDEFINEVNSLEGEKSE
ncbi:MAG: transcriptional regulator NrdR [Treponemataceae bacterium]|nr:transcriptional repressor NrdR [Treponema sp.]MDE5613320.1 transcriptional regulator NrdR [Treponemataceae bacterium]MDE5797962.1 transcriptional regulator NrdR [Treponemataceae bacterium]MDE7139691.1 transcriptional regulator NrdR [Treponemataceae bacterium]MDE7227144.1 transcriptional regulator NrdR [Treponemataceae bacterium]